MVLANSVEKTSGKSEISGFVIAGGKSSRLKLDKVLLPWHGDTLLGHAVERVRQVCGSVTVCADRKDLGPHLPQSCEIICDALPNAGPLAGIVSGLERSHTEWNLFLAVDLPLLPVALLAALVERAESMPTAIAGTLCILPQMNGLLQPLCGLYHHSLRDGLRGALEEGKYKVMLALREALLRAEGRDPLVGRGLGRGEAAPLGTPDSSVELLDAIAFAARSADLNTDARDWFLNINTPEDWQRAREIAAI
ncbi:MAG: molybdenum cofactor guanylyltransferase [Acidobacteriaceae bacterium]